MKKRIPYGIGDFEKIRKDGMYYVDKTAIIEELEQHQYPFLIRPRRFGKSLLVSMLQHYYDVKKENAFDELFDGLYIHDHPTSEKNDYLILRLDFTGIETSMGKDKLFQAFTEKVRLYANTFVKKYSDELKTGNDYDFTKAADPAQIISQICSIVMHNEKQIYLLIDEYDNFANDLIGANDDSLYYDILSKTGFVRTFYEAIKTGAQEGAISRIFMTGVSPIMLEDLTSGFNIASNITLDHGFNKYLGFTQREVETMLDYYCCLNDVKYNRDTVLKEMKTYYNGYLFSEEATERLYNPDMILFFMKYLAQGRYPREMTDTNVKTDYGKLKRLLREDQTKSLTMEKTKLDEINEEDEIITNIKRMFPLEAINGREEIISLMFYMGMLTIKEPYLANVKLHVPNLVVKELYWEYLYNSINKELNDTLKVEPIGKALYRMAKTGDITDFVQYTYDKVLKVMSNRDLIKMEEKHIKMIFLSFLSVNAVYIPYSELELNGGYSDIVLYPDSRYEVNNSQIWELKFLKKGDDRNEKLKEARAQIKEYENDPNFQRLTANTTVYKYIIIGTKDDVEIIDVTKEEANHI